MRVDAKIALAPPSAAAPPRTAAGGRFALDGSAAPAASARAASAAPLATVDALLALQGEGDPRERRRRSLKRGHDLLDSLDALKASLLAGRVSPARLQALVAQSAAQGASGDPGLDLVVAHIELRAAVELAKLRLR